MNSMSNIDTARSYIFDNKIFVVIRDSDQNRALKIAYTLIEAGVQLVEISLLTPNAYDIVKKLRTDNIFVGVGTTMTSDMAKKSIDSGAFFIISPHIDKEIISTAMDHDVFVTSGAVTPNEIVTANQLGSQLIKVFPAHGFGGVKYLKSLIDIFPNFNFMPTGGVNELNIKEYFDIGVKAVGVSNCILDRSDIESENYKNIKRKAEYIMGLI